jgi:hypothetical protein
MGSRACRNKPNLMGGRASLARSCRGQGPKRGAESRVEHRRGRRCHMSQPGKCAEQSQFVAAVVVVDVHCPPGKGLWDHIAVETKPICRPGRLPWLDRAEGGDRRKEQGPESNTAGGGGAPCLAGANARNKPNLQWVAWAVKDRRRRRDSSLPWLFAVPNKTPATKVEKVESEPRFGVNIYDYSGRLRLLSGASNKANFPGPTPRGARFCWRCWDDG